MTATALKKVTYEDLYTLPDNMIGEIIDGKLVATPRPSFRHSNVASVVTCEISGPFQRGRGGPGGWIILYETADGCCSPFTVKMTVFAQSLFRKLDWLWKIFGGNKNGWLRTGKIFL